MENNHWKDVYIWFLTDPPEMKGSLDDAIESLEKTIIALKYRAGRDGETSGQRAADALGISRERVRQILARAQNLYSKAHPATEAPAEIPKLERLHRFMLAYQQEHGKPAAILTIAKEAGIWKSGTSVLKGIRELARQGLVEKRRAKDVNVAQWWALELCRDCKKRRRGQSLSVCHECADAALLQMRTRNQ